MSDLKAFISKTKIASDDCNTHSRPRSVAKVRNYDYASATKHVV